MNIQAFLTHAKKIRQKIMEMENPLVVHHYDADGISSGALVYGCLKDADRIAVRTLKPEFIDEIKDREVVFVDLGSALKEINDIKDAVIIDHHQIEGVKKPMINPRMFGIDGDKELSSAGTAYFVFRKFVDLGVVGATADMQQPFIGMNRVMVDEGIQMGVIEEKKDLLLYGRNSRPLHAFLAYSDDPYIEGLSYNEEGALAFLKNIDIALKEGEKWRTYEDLTKEEKRKLISNLVCMLVERGDLAKAKQLIGDVYSLKNRPKDSPLYDVREFATLLNATGRHGKPDIGVKICLNDRDAIREGVLLLEKHRKMIKEGIEYAKQNMIELDGFYLIDGRGVIEDGIIGIICGMVMKAYYKKPIIGLSYNKEKRVKISTRANKKLVKKGLNLGIILKKTSEKVGGVGGGHHIAAGAEISENDLERFLEVFGSYIKAQVL